MRKTEFIFESQSNRQRLSRVSLSQTAGQSIYLVKTTQLFRIFFLDLLSFH